MRSRKGQWSSRLSTWSQRYVSRATQFLKLNTLQRDKLQAEVTNQASEIEAFKSLMPITASNSGNAPNKTDMRSLVTRLVQKEKQVTQMQAEIERLKQNSNESRDAEEQARRERERAKLSKILEEVESLKAKV